MENFPEKVEELVSGIKKSNPEVKVWVQLDINPRVPESKKDHQSLSSEEIVKQISEINEFVDLVALYYPPGQSQVVQQVITKLRK